MAEAPKIINIDEGDINADWIKLVNGGRSRIRELAIHKKLAAQYAKEEGETAEAETEVVEEETEAETEAETEETVEEEEEEDDDQK